MSSLASVIDYAIRCGRSLTRVLINILAYDLTRVYPLFVTRLTLWHIIYRSTSSAKVI